MMLTGCSGTQPGAGSPATTPSTASSAAAPSRTATSTVPPRTAVVPSTVRTSHYARGTGHSSSQPSSGSAPAPSRTSPSGAVNTHRSLPVDEPAHGAGQVITVVAPSQHSTTAVLQRWARVAGGWRKVGASVPANLGTDGMTRHPSESRSATPIGSFTLTDAFGHDSDPGTRLPYAHTTPDDWWISQPGPLYNTRQRCASGCDFTRGDPNEHLWYETPAYDYAVVIDYNTRNAPGGVTQGAGSAFFLHVSEGRPTAGCVSIPVDRLLTVLSWLRPAKHPRILIGTG